MDFKKFLEMANDSIVEAKKKESTSKKDHKAEKAGRKVAKDIEYDEGHKGKDDEGAEKAGRKVTKDIEYDDKKNKKKKSLKDWFEIIDNNKLNEAEKITMEPARQNTQVIKQGTKVLGTVSNPQLASQIKQSIGKGEMSLAGIGMKEEAEDNPPSTEDGELLEKWAGDAEVKATGLYANKSVAELKSMLAKLKKSGPHGNDSPAAKRMRQINFALRAKGGWKKGEGAAMKEESMDESGLQAYLGKKKYGKEGMAALQKAGREGASKEKMAQIRAKHDKLDELSPATMSSAAAKARGQGTAISARSGIDPMIGKGPDKDPQSQKDFAKGQKRFAQADKFEKGAGLKSGQAGSHMYDLSTGKYSDRGPESLDEKAKNPYAIGMAQAMKSTGDKPPLKKSTITKAHDIAKKIKQQTDEAESPSDQADFGAGLGAGRSNKVLEKKQVKESMNTLEAAYHEGKSHGLSKHGYACRYNEGSEEHKRYHEGFKEGLDECYGLQPNRGLVVGETMPAATVPGMAQQAMEDSDLLDEVFFFPDTPPGPRTPAQQRERNRPQDTLSMRGGRNTPVGGPEGYKDMVRGTGAFGPTAKNIYGIKGPKGNLPEADLDEMNKTQYMQHKAKTTPGDTFKAFGQTFHDKDVLEDNFAFESLDRQLNALLDQDTTVINEGISVNMSQGLGGPNGEDSVSVTAQGDDAAKLFAFIKQVGLGGLGSDKDEVTSMAEPAIAVVSDYGAPKFSGHDDMKSLLSKVTGDDYKDEEDHEHDHSASVCNECGMNETKCECDEEKIVDETQTPDQLTDTVAEDDGEGDIAAYGQEAAINTSMPSKGGATNEDTGSEADGSDPVGQAEEEEAEDVSESEELSELKGMTYSDAANKLQDIIDYYKQHKELIDPQVKADLEARIKKLNSIALKSFDTKDRNEKFADAQNTTGMSSKTGTKLGIGYQDRYGNPITRSQANLNPNLEKTRDIKPDQMEQNLSEWANDAGKDGTEQSFERDIEFMTKVIAGGLNKPKVTGQTTIPVIASQDARNGDEDVTAWKRLAGISK